MFEYRIRQLDPLQFSQASLTLQSASIRSSVDYRPTASNIRPFGTGNAAIKRSADLFLALLALALFALPMLAIALAIRFDSPGPALFRQPRIGLSGRPFELLKFRTMRHHTPCCGDCAQARRYDPRVTRVGHWLRCSSFDELPQLFNVLRGEMSVVGPRPHTPGTRAGGRLFEEVAPHYGERHQVRPGMTGLAQIRGWRGETDTEDKLLRRVDSDLEYIAGWSLALDLSGSSGAPSAQSSACATPIEMEDLAMSEILDRLPELATLPQLRSARLTDRPAWRTPPVKAVEPRVAVLIPCCNEQEAIGKVVTDFRAALPSAAIYVYDNNSTDRTMLNARAAGALVRSEALQGKGHVVRRMFADIEADIFVLVDGDDTYDAAAAPAMLQLLTDCQLDMVTATRSLSPEGAYRLGHRLGNRVLTALVRWVFGEGISDLLSGYRVFSRRFVKSFPAMSAGFETETEFTVHALALHMPVREIEVAYRGRSVGSRSKLHTISDGLRILRSILVLVEQERPLPSFAVTAAVLLMAGLGLGVPVVLTFLHTGIVPRLPTAILSTGLVLLACLSLTCGLILDAVSRGRKEFKRLAYLSIPACPVSK
jgi:lipopolysaccharide/colanic/teichoic acid biosynthesis glycosyltransferase